MILKLLKNVKRYYKCLNYIFVFYYFFFLRSGDPFAVVM